MKMESRAYSNLPVKLSLSELLESRGGADALRRVSLERFYQEIEKSGVGYGAKHLRKMVDGVRPLKPAAIEAIADALDIPPDHFIEYRIWRVQRIVEENPMLVDRVYDLLVAQARAEQDPSTP